jgi:hypothetical protein
MSIVSAQAEVIDQIKKMLADNDCDETQLRIVGSLGFGEIPEGFKIMPGEVTNKDQVEEIGELKFIVANILVKRYKNFTITCRERNGLVDLNVAAGQM